MDMILGLIDSLGLNSTLFIQFGIFMVSFGILQYVLFKPYNKAAQERYNRTVGNEESAHQFDEEIELIQRQYREKAQATNNDVQAVFLNEEQSGKNEVNSILKTAKDKYQSNKEKLEKEAAHEYSSEQSKIPNLVPELKDALKKVLVEERV